MAYVMEMTILSKTSMPIAKNELLNSISYQEYRLHTENQLTQMGADLANPLHNYALENLKNIRYLESNIELTEELLEIIRGKVKPIILAIITEGWCGDAAQNLPVFGLLEKFYPDLFEIKVFLRDQNLDIMDRYLTHGGRAIPKVVGLEKGTYEEIFVWGPRPLSAQLLMDELKSKGASLPEKIESLSKWYSLDQTRSLQGELMKIFYQKMN